MLISELQDHLEAIKKEYGDLTVRHSDDHYFMNIFKDSFDVVPLSLERHRLPHDNEKMLLISGR